MTEIGEGVGKPPLEKRAPEKADERERVKIRFSVFFDGTLNNRTNIEEKENQTAIYAKHGSKENSYSGAFTNVAKMERFVDPSPGYDATLTLYVEGPGTMNLKSDKLRGYALGTGASGVTNKVNRAMVSIVDDIRGQYEASETVIERLSFDVFGFSRGAANARHFVHKAMLKGHQRSAVRSVRQRLERLGFEVGTIDFRFAGLYDTVSSHGLSFSNDTRALNLDAVRNVEKVVHLVAAEEHRKNFSLTNIESNSGGREIYLPGVHSDVGGGYNHGVAESQIVYRGSRQSNARAIGFKKVLLDEGWYKDADLERRAVSHQVSLKATRESISNEYSKIPLHLMADFAVESGMQIGSKMKRVERIPPELAGAASLIEAYAGGGNSKAEDWFGKTDAWLQELRYKYLHYSARYEVGHHPRWIKGRRARVIYDG